MSAYHPTAPLAELSVVITKGTTPTTLGFDFETDGVAFIRAQNLVDGEVKPEVDPLFISKQTHAALGRSQIQPGDVLISIAGTIGRAAIVRPDAQPMNCNQAVAIVRPTALIDGRYLLHWLASQGARQQISKSAVTGTISNLSLSQIGGLAVPLPSLPEQRRIAAILDAADALRQKRRQALALLDQLSQAIFIEMFGDPAQRGSAIDIRPLGQLCGLITDGTHKTPSYVEAGVPFVTVKNIASGKLDLTTTKFITQREHEEISRRAKPEQGDILVSKDGTIGIPCLIEQPAHFSIFVSVALLKPIRSAIDPQFLTEQIRTPWVQNQIRAGTKGIAIRHLHLGDFKRLRIVVPKMQRQREFTRRVKKVAETRERLVLASEHLDRSFASLQHRAFRGEL